MNKYILIAFLIAPVAMHAHEHENGRERFNMNLTEEQRACVEAQNCPRPERQEGERPERTPEMRECMARAFETCGIERLERPDRPEGEREGRRERRRSE